MPNFRGRIMAVAAAAMLALSVAPLIESTPAAAAPPADAPDNLSPTSGVAVSGNPELAWDEVPGATRYRVEIHGNATFTSQIMGENTYNSHFTPWVELPTGTVHWRVAAMNGNERGPWASGSFTKSLDAPSLNAPDDGDTLDFPGEAPTFSWDALPNARSYVLEIDDADDFNGAKRHVVRTTTFTPLNLNASGQDYHWRVRGSSQTNGEGVVTSWSESRSFSVGWSATVNLVTPPDGDTQTDVELVWDPVPGATHYNVQVDLDEEFTTPHVVEALNVHSTRYTYRETVDNASYWWRVQPIDAQKNLGEWSAPQQFTRDWPGWPAQVHPAAGAATSGDLYFEWEAHDHASYYEVQTALDANFSVGVRMCQTRQTRVYEGRHCEMGSNPTNAGGYYWRVRGRDRLRDIIGLWSPARHQPAHTPPPVEPGTFEPAGYVAPQLPAHCAELACASSAMPTLSWQPYPGATSYRLFVAVDPNFTTLVGDFQGGGSGLPLNTHSSDRGPQTAYTPRHELPDNDAGESYYWYVQACASTGCTAGPVGANPQVPSSAFKKSSTPVQRLSVQWNQTGGPAGGSVAHFPRFAWEPYLTTTSNDPDDPAPGTTDLEAERYQIQVSTVNTFATLIDDKTVDQPFYTPWDRTYPEGPLYWRVRAIDGSDNRLAWSTQSLAGDPPTAGFTKKSPFPTQVSPVTGHVVRGVPTFRWNQLDYAAQYEIEVYEANGPGQTFSPADRRLLVKTFHREYTHSQPLAVGSYYWRIRRLDADNRVGPWSHESAAGSVPVLAPTFRVADVQVPLAGPAHNARITGNPIVYSWNRPDDDRASYYRVERSQSPTMSSPQGVRTTVMTSHAPPENIPNGDWYWRITALDASDNVIGRSEVRKFTKANPPAAGSVYLPITPCRLVDTRTKGGRFAPNAVRSYRVTGTGSAFANQGGKTGGCGIPVGATAAELSVTAVDPTANGYFRAWPSDVGAPNATFLNFATRKSVTNTGAVTLASSGTSQIRVSNHSSSTHYVIDVQGYFVDRNDISYGSVFVPVTPCRVVNTRSAGGAFGAHEERSYQVAGNGSRFATQGGKANGCGIPDGVDAVAASVSVVEPTGNGYFRAWPQGEGMPNATFLNYVRNQSVSNTGAVKLAPTGALDLRVRNAGPSAHYVIDVQGYYIDRDDKPDGAVYVGVTPCRVVDTRSRGGQFASGTKRDYQVAGEGSTFANQGGKADGCGLPDGAAAVAASVTAVGPSANGYFRGWPSNVAEPGATFLNFAKDQSITNTGAIALAPTGTRDLSTKNYGARTHYVIDVQGYYVV